MNFKNKTIAILFFFLATINIEASTIKHIFIDINTIIKPSQTAASKVVGIINSMKYTAVVGNIPSKHDFFKALKHVPARTNQQVYNDDLLMPAILCDWLLGLQTNHAIRSAIIHHLDHNNNLSDIEKTIFKNISSMMMSPATFIDTQYLIKDFLKILQALKKAGYTVYLIGNWDKESEPYLMKLLHGNNLPDARHCYFSCKSKQLKPTADYFDQLLKHYNLNKNECLLVDVEKNHAQSARSYGLTTILLHGHNIVQLKSELSRTGIRL